MEETDLQGIPRGFISTSALKKIAIKTGDREEDRVTLHEMGYTAGKLRSRVRNGDFIYGIHYLDVRPRSSEKPVYTWNIRAISRMWHTPPERRDVFDAELPQTKRHRKQILKIA